MGIVGRGAVRGLHRPRGGSMVYFVRGEDCWELLGGRMFKGYIDSREALRCTLFEGRIVEIIGMEDVRGLHRPKGGSKVYFAQRENC